MTQPTAVRLELDRLVREYIENLNVTLRGFKAAEQFPFLEVWVPSDDPTDSLVDLVDLARAGGIARVCIVLEPATLARVDRARVEAAAGSFEERAAAAHVELWFGGVEPEPLDVPPCHAERLRALLNDVRHEGPLTPADGHDLVETADQGTTLRALVDRKRRHIARAAFTGAAGATQRGVLEGLCRAIENKPIQEAADHAVIALEFSLREPALPPPVPGVVTPTNAGPAFALPQRLVRGLLAQYRAATGPGDTRNFYDRPIGPRWAELDEPARAAAVRAALDARKLTDTIEVVGMDGPKRVVVQFARPLPNAEQQQLLVDLESHLRDVLEPTLQLTPRIKSDINILRQPDRRPS